MPSALILILGRTTLWQVRRACGGLCRSRLRCSCDAAKAQRVQFELLLPCVPGALLEEAVSRECFARNAERAVRLSCKGALDRMSPSAERALLPTSGGNDDERALVPMALICVSEHSEANRPTFCRSPVRVPFGSYSATQRVALKRGAEAPGQRTARGRLQRLSWAALPVTLAYGTPLCRASETCAKL